MVRRPVTRYFVVDLHLMPVRIAAAVSPAAAELALVPAYPQARAPNRRGAALQRLRADGAPGDAAAAGMPGRGQLERGRGVVAVAGRARAMTMAAINR